MKEFVEFALSDVDGFAARLDSHGWVNLQPAVDDDDLPPPTGALFGLFSARGPVVPFCTWHSGERSAGVQHGTGPKVASRVDIPVGWRILQDHPRRGLVVRVPSEVPDADVLRWLVGVGAALCPAPTGERWLAEIHS